MRFRAPATASLLSVLLSDNPPAKISLLLVEQAFQPFSTSASSCRCWRLQQLHLQHRMQFNAGQLGHPGLPVIGIEETDSGDADLGRRNRGLEGDRKSVV